MTKDIAIERAGSAKELVLFARGGGEPRGLVAHTAQRVRERDGGEKEAERKSSAAGFH